MAVPTPAEAASGALLDRRYRLDELLSEADGMRLWRGADTLVGELPVAIRAWWGLSAEEVAALHQRLERLKAVLHPQIPRLGEQLPAGGGCWQVREWISGRTYQDLLQARQERQLVFGSGEVLLLLRQLLPALAALHGQNLVHGDLTPANLIRRDSDGLPVLIDFGLQAAVAGQPLTAATAGYAPPQARHEPYEIWMDLYSLGVVALVLLSGEQPAALMDPVSLAWRWPEGIALDAAFRHVLERLLTTSPEQRFHSAAEVAEALAALPVPETTGPVSRSDRTAVLLPQLKPEQQAEAAAAPAPARLSRDERRRAKEQAAEGRFWPVVIALLLAALVGSALGWLLLGRNRQSNRPATALAPELSLPPAELDQRQQLLNRLRALQVDQTWFLKLVDSSLAAQFPERGGRAPTDSLEDAPLRKIWNDLAQEWLVRVEQLPVPLRQRLGSYTAADWKEREKSLTKEGLSPLVLRQLVSSSAQNLLPGRNPETIPAEPVRQIWYAAALRSLEGLKVQQLKPVLNIPRSLSTSVDGQGAKLIAISVPKNHRLVLGVNGTPLMQMSLFAANGKLLEPRGPLRVLSVARVENSPVQLLIRNDGLAPGLISLSVRVDPPLPKPARTPQRPRQQQPSAQPHPQLQQQRPQDSVLDEINQPTVDPFGN